MDEIKQLDNKYLVLKIEDLEKYFSQFTSGIFTTDEEQKFMDSVPFTTVITEIKKQREADGKKENRYIVLNLDDEIDIDCLISKLQKFKKLGRDDYYSQVKMDRVAVDLVNAILKAKQEHD